MVARRDSTNESTEMREEEERVGCVHVSIIGSQSSRQSEKRTEAERQGGSQIVDNF